MSSHPSPSSRKTQGPILQSLGQRKKGKKYGAHRGATGQSKSLGPSNASKKQNELETSLEDLEEFKNLKVGSSGDLRSLLESGELRRSSEKNLLQMSDGITADLGFGREHGTWKSRIGHEYRNSVVKILNQLVQFDWEQPYKRADDGQAIGSGFFVSEDGIIVTNAHVIEDASKLWITVPSEGEERYEAEVLGVCFDVDLALIRAANAPVKKYFELGDSDTVQYGQEVLTLGYPLGMESLKLTEGIISGRQDGFFQTDAPLNPGNSGGPMLASDGKVIGINVAIAQQSQNVGFSIPVYQLKMIFENLKNRPPNKKVLHKPILGAEFSNTSDQLLHFMSLPKNKKGVFVRRCYEGFPLYNAGVRDGDILHSFDGFDLDNFGDAQVPWSPYARVSLESLMDLMVNDSKPEIEYSTDGVLKKSKIIFEDEKNKGYPILPPVREFHHPYEKVDYEVICGMVVMELTLNHIQLFHETVPSEQVLRALTPYATSFKERMSPSLVITNILLGSTLAKVDVFMPGTLISAINGTEVKTLKEFREAMQKPVSKGNEFYITIKSKENELMVLSLQDSLQEELDLTETYYYPLSFLVIDALAKANDSMLNYITRNDKKAKKKLKLMVQHAQQRKELDSSD